MVENRDEVAVKLTALLTVDRTHRMDLVKMASLRLLEVDKVHSPVRAREPKHWDKTRQQVQMELLQDSLGLMPLLRGQQTSLKQPRLLYKAQNTALVMTHTIKREVHR